MRKLSFWKKKCPHSWLSLCAWKNVSLMLLALLALSCRTTKENTSIRLADSLQWNRKVSVTLATIQSSLAELTIPMDSLRRLPPGAVYTNKSGNTRVTASINAGNLHVEAETESVPELKYTEEENQVHIRDELSEAETIKEPVSIPLWNRLKHGLTGILVIIIVIIIIKTYKK